MFFVNLVNFLLEKKKESCYHVITEGGEFMNDRIAFLRREILKISMEEFGNRLNISKAAVSHIEKGINQPSAQTVSMICDRFGVSEEWLRTGKGNPLVEKTRDEELITFIGNLQTTDNNGFKKRLLHVLSVLEESDWEVLEKIANKLHEESD